MLDICVPDEDASSHFGSPKPNPEERARASESRQAGAASGGVSASRPERRVIQGNILHARNETSVNPLENATEHLDDDF